MSWTDAGRPLDRIGDEKGEWFERYVEDIFKSAGFVTERDKIFHPTVRHEIDVWVDVWAEEEFGAIAVGCKDWERIAIGDLKKELDAFETKVRQTGARTGVFALNTTGEERFQKYRDYLKNTVTTSVGSRIQSERSARKTGVS